MTTNSTNSTWTSRSHLYPSTWAPSQVTVCPAWRASLCPLDQGRKPLMLTPFLGHILSGVLILLNIHFTQWDARMLWLSETYVIFGGYTLLSIAMYGYIGDVTSAKERTVMIAILGALGMVMMPLADFCGGQIYHAGQTRLCITGGCERHYTVRRLLCCVRHLSGLHCPRNSLHLAHTRERDQTESHRGGS